MSEDPIQERAELYVRAERSAREFFARRFGRLCSACGAAAAQGFECLCCCVGVRCMGHLDRSPVLTMILQRSVENSRVAAQARQSASGSLLGPQGCRLDQGRPAPCNAIMCAHQSDCLRSVMPATQVAALTRALHLFHLVADPRLRNITTLKRLTAELEGDLATAERMADENMPAFNTAVGEAIAAIRRMAGITQPEAGPTTKAAEAGATGQLPQPDSPPNRPA